MDDTLQRLQLDITARLLTDAALDTASIRAARPRAAETATMIEDSINAALDGLETRNGKSGLAIVVRMPALRIPQPGSPGPQGEVHVTVLIQENPLVNMDATNGTGITAELAAVHVLRSLHHFRIGKRMLAPHKDGAQATDVADDLVAYEVTFVASMSIQHAAAVLDVTITQAPGAVTLATPTADAEIWFSLNGAFPAPDADGCTLYTSTFDPPSGSLVRAAAYKNGLNGSAVAELLIP